MTGKRQTSASVFQLIRDWVQYWQSDVPSICLCTISTRFICLSWRGCKSSPYEYSSFHEHFNRSFRGNGAWGQSLLDRSRLASRYCDSVLQTWRVAFDLSSLWRTDWSVVCRADSTSVHFNYTALGFIMCVCVCVWPAVQPKGIVPHFPCACSACSVWWLDWLGAVWPGASVCWGRLQNGTQEEIRNMHSTLCLWCWK